MDHEFDVLYAAAIWLELFLYGIYTCLFLIVMHVLSTTRSTRNTTTSYWVFLCASICMFIIATLHMVVGIFRFTSAYVLLADPRGAIFYFIDTTTWHFRANNVLLCLMTWTGDALVIYRCYFVWSNNVWVIMVPSFLLAASIGINSFVLYWWDHPFMFNSPFGIVPWLDTIYPLAFAQNVMATSLISYKILSQYRSSAAHGVVDSSSRLSLYRVLRIIVESAMIYPLELLILIILYLKESPAQVILQAAVVPSIGIVFVLIAVRVHAARNRSILPTSVSTMPVWRRHGEAIEMQRSRVSFEVSQKPELEDDVPTPSSYGSRSKFRRAGDTDMR